jgi:predicted enzyme related to lactoylglutathione lyase
MATVHVRYIVNDVDAAIAFYCQQPRVMHPSLSRGDLRLVLSQPGGQNVGGGSTLADGRTPEPGGWNHFAIEATDLAETVERLRHAGGALSKWRHPGGLGATRPWWRTRPAIRSNCSSRCGPKRAWRRAPEPPLRRRSHPLRGRPFKEDTPDDS